MVFRAIQSSLEEFGSLLSIQRGITGSMVFTGDGVSEQAN